MTRDSSDKLREHSRTIDEIAISFRTLADELERRAVDSLNPDSLDEISRCINALARVRAQVENSISGRGR